MASQPKTGEIPQSKRSTSSDFIDRSNKSSNTPGTLTFLGLRPLVPLLQYGILARGLGSDLLRRVGLDTLPAGPPNTGTVLDGLGLSPYRLILFGMSAGAAVKQIYWLLGVNEQNFPPGMSVFVTIFNAVFDTLNSLVFTCTLTSASLSSGSKFPQTPLLVGAVMYVVGIALELGSEVQRKQFKSKPENKGKVYTGGLWSVSRHMNYFGYTLWRAGYAVAAGGWIWGAFCCAFSAFDFVSRGIPVLEDYCQGRYGEQWDEYKRKTPYQFLPYLY